MSKFRSKEEWQEEYRQQRLDPRWQKKRLKVLEYAEWRCQCCGNRNDRTLHVHHSYYTKGKKCWDYPTGALIAVCDCCHEKLHPEKERPVPIASPIQQEMPKPDRLATEEECQNSFAAMLERLGRM